MWLVLCNPTDSAALWAYAGLRDRGLRPLELVASHEFSYSTWSVHYVDEHGANFEIALQGGRKLISSEIKGVLNRLSEIPVDHLVFTSEEETRYAGQELSALVLSWMACISPVSINKTSPRGLSGAWRSPLEWALLAAHAGLQVPPVRLSSHRVYDVVEPFAGTRCFIVLGERVFGGELPPQIAQACVRLAHLAEIDLLGVELGFDQEHGMPFISATPLPDFRLGGRGFIEHLYHHLTGLPAKPT